MTTMKQFIIELLAARAAPLSIDEIYQAFQEHDRFADRAKPSIRTQLNRLCEEHQIQRITRGVYAANSVDRSLYVEDINQEEFKFEEQEVPPIPRKSEGIQFTSKNEQIQIDESAHTVAPKRLALHQELVGAVTDFLERTEGTNVLASVRKIVISYRDELIKPQIQIDTIYAFGLRLDICCKEIERDVKDGKIPELELTQLEPLMAVMAMHGIAVMSTERGKHLAELAAKYNDNANDLKFRHASERFSQAVNETPEVFSAEVRQLVHQLAPIYGLGDHPNRSRQTSKSTNINLLISVASLAIASVNMSMTHGQAMGEMMEAMSQTSQLLSDKALSFIWRHQDELKMFVAASREDFGWLERMITWINLRLSTDKR